MYRVAIAIVLAAAALRAHDLPRLPVVVDTDMALDDVRALSLLLTARAVDVRAVVTSDGGCAPATGATNVLRILRFLGKETVPVGVGRSLSALAPPWREQSESLGWAADSLPVAGAALSGAVAVLRAAITGASERVAYVCLGPLTNLADALEVDRGLRTRLKAVICRGGDPHEWNSQRDPSAAAFVKRAGLRVEVVGRGVTRAPVLDVALLDEIQRIGTPSARLIALTHRHPRVRQLIEQRHLRLWDDLVALRVLRPSLRDWDREVYLELLRALPARQPVVMARYPTAAAELQPDVRLLVGQIIARHGEEEWKAALLTSELHRHLGTYSILGAKMGIRARELLGAALDELRVESHAGSKPPLSCFNDGLQVATGASLGRGTIRVVGDDAPRCEAEFVCGERKVRLRLKPDVAVKIAAEMSALQTRNGERASPYSEEMRRLSLRNWLELDRREIFQEVSAHAHP
ncbi:MAG: nucleoside hydrolase [Verrucomicrobiae bacterium]|nr:nucleoside hydrolase [Verrucomicrobiae bacterium]